MDEIPDVHNVVPVSKICNGDDFKLKKNPHLNKVTKQKPVLTHFTLSLKNFSLTATP